ncbi:hypothetical protein ACVW1C_000487 [Bradyrhizobium sp. USDA 4011]
MHILRPQFRIEDDHALAFAAARGFGAIVAADAAARGHPMCRS